MPALVGTREASGQWSREVLSSSVYVQVLFWGVRELKRVQLFEVERPLVKVECAGQQLESEEIESFKNHPNFKEMVRYMNVVSRCRWCLLSRQASTEPERSLPASGVLRDCQSRPTSTLP